MPKLILELDNGTREEYTTFFAVLAVDTDNGADIREVIGFDCRTLVAGAMLKKAAMKASFAFDEFLKRAFGTRDILAIPDDEALRKRIKWSTD